MRWRDHRDFPGGPMVKTFNAGSVGSIPGQETKISHGTAENKQTNNRHHTLESQASSWDQLMLLGKQTSRLPCWSCHLICHFHLCCSLDIWKQRGAPLFREHLPSFLVVWPQFRWSSPSGDAAVSSMGVDCDVPLGILWSWVGLNGRERCSEGCSLTKTLGHHLLHHDPFGDACLINATQKFPWDLSQVAPTYQASVCSSFKWDNNSCPSFLLVFHSCTQAFLAWRLWLPLWCYSLFCLYKWLHSILKVLDEKSPA